MVVLLFLVLLSLSLSPSLSLLFVHHGAELPVVDLAGAVQVELGEGGLRLLLGQVRADPLELGPAHM